MQVGGYRGTRQAEDLEGLRALLAWRDSKDGAVFWFENRPQTFPKLAIRISGEAADIHYFPKEGHPGFRCQGGDGLPKGGMTTLVFEGSDPGSGEDTPNQFVVSSATVWLVAKEFFLSNSMSNAVSWSEL